MLTKQAKTISLALQGGGSHGAFTWGVLDRLLAEPRLNIEAISGASAGAINAVVLAHGLTTGGRDGAREALSDFWRKIADAALFDFTPQIEEQPASSAHFSPGIAAFLSLTRWFSPYQLNPLDLNPLRDILEETIDFERLRREQRIKLFVATTKVSTGTLRMFTTADITLEVVLASACLPSVHHAIEIDGEAYWDGGLTANPALFPLLYDAKAADVIAVLLYPLRAQAAPTTASAIRDRLTEIGFVSSFYAELRALTCAQQDAARSWLPLGRLERRLRNFRVHLIEAQQLGGLGATSKLDTRMSFLSWLRDEGKKKAKAWLKANVMISPANLRTRLQEAVHYK